MTDHQVIDLLTDTLNLLDSFKYENDEDSQSKSFFTAHINEDWFFHVKSKIEKMVVRITDEQLNSNRYITLRDYLLSDSTEYDDRIIDATTTTALNIVVDSMWK